MSLVEEKGYYLQDGADIPEIVSDITGFEDPNKQPEDYAVYIIKCDSYDCGYVGKQNFLDSWEDWVIRGDFEKCYDPHDPEKWAWAAFYSDELYYVGQTNSLHFRIHDHAWDPDRTSVFNCVFTPTWLQRVEWVKSRDAALKLESELAEQYSDKSENKFAYSA